MNATLPDNWKAIADYKAIRLLMLSLTHFSAVQREIIVYYDGRDEEMAVHGKPLSQSIQNQISTGLPYPVRLTDETISAFASRLVFLSRNMRQFQVCLGANHLESFSIWSTIDNAHVDNNPFSETEYVITCRADDCSHVVPFGKNNIRCMSCAKVIRTLRERLTFAQKDEVSAKTANKYLSLKQALEKLKLLHAEMRKKDKKIAYLEHKVEAALATEGIDVEEELSQDMSEILCRANLTQVQKLFLQQQIEASTKPDARGHRWHPAMIRLALHIKMISTSAYDALKDSGFLKLPCNRTLFNYSHFINPTEGISPGLIELVKKQLTKIGNEEHQKYFALLVDEMYISKNLVYRSSDGKLIGYTHLDEVDKEIAELENRLQSAAAGEENSSKTPQPALANKMLAFMVKGLCSSIKCVVASYACSELNKDMLYTRSWDVISNLELAGIKVLCYVCDGNASNRAFFSMHTPATTGHEVMFDTINFCSPERRPLYFVSDVCHLLKTARNCFHNSGREENKTRCLRVNNEFIEWKTIIRLYQTYKTRTFRKSYKLNPQNVFINSFSAMKVKFAAQVLSNTVASDLQKQKWPGLTETIKFIRMFNKFFDTLNGAHSSQWIKTKNHDLKPYDKPDDERFKWLKENFLVYLKDWKKKNEEELKLPPKELEKTILAQPTLDGLEISIRSIEACISFLLKKGAKFVMARAFSQDPLEQHFSRQRSGFGGSTNPNALQTQQRIVSLAVQGQLGIKRRGANVQDEDEKIENLSESLPKRPNQRKTN